MVAQTPTFILEESLVVLNPARDRVHLLDPSARVIWEAFAAGLGRDEIVAALVAAQGGYADRVRQEINNLLQSWQQEGLTADAGPVPAMDKAPEEPLAMYTAVADATGPVYTDDAFRLRDLIFRIRSGDATVRERVQALCGHLTAEPEYSDGTAETVFDFFQHKENWLLVQDGKQRAIADSLDQAVLALSEELTEIWHERRDWLLVAHAAAVAKDNTCILLPGTSGSGKTTLAAALACSGFTLLGDEIIPIIQESGHAVAQPFCLRIKQGSVKPLQSLYPQIDTLHPYPWGETNLRFLLPPDFQQEEADKTWPITHIVFPQYACDAPMQLKPISSTEAFQRLLGAECLLGSPILPETVEKLVRWIQERPAFTMKYGDLKENTIKF